ncbi:acetyltransferase [Exophiala aquamarina CBS 119918]|uniref:Acetyltransferase n=1 Tax=Exophiala aquamarina CBS 119918 TaxID=1182545 RepID=A0A072Q097_9EURO|nr:acetyltransferase [Exophiala aquamarina CBS 119918]KEF61280.1 acetyltransferase [Exophiala aquamarina CBS 119918]
MAATEKDHAVIAIAKQLNHIPEGEEYEKMISGMLYDSLVPELEAARWKARKWCHRYNTEFPGLDDPNFTMADAAKARYKKLTQIFGKVGEDAFIEPPLVLDYGCNISIGERFYAGMNTVILDCSLVLVGHRVMFGPNVSIFAATHETEVSSRRENIEFARKVAIGDDCWIGGGTVILPGVTIGKGCTIGAASVVSKDIPPWSVAMGSPARVVKTVQELPDMPPGRENFSAIERQG